MNNKLKISNKNALMGDFTFDLSSGMLDFSNSRINQKEIFSGVKNGKVFVKNRLTSINSEKFMALPKTIRDRILEFPNSDYARDVLAQPKGAINSDTFPNFNNISYTSKCEAIILNDENGCPVRMTMF